MTEATTTPSIFDRIGGEVIVDRLVEAFYARMDSLSEARAIRDMHDADLEPTKRVLKRYLTEWMGGPNLYSSERGHPRLRQRHMGFPIDTSARDAWLLCRREHLKKPSPTKRRGRKFTRPLRASPTSCAIAPTRPAELQP